MSDAAILIPITALAFLVGLLAGLFAWLRARSAHERADRALREEHERAAGTLREELATLRAARAADAEKLSWSEQAEQRLRDAFEALAGQTLQRNAESYTVQAKEGLKGVIGPLQEKLSSLDAHVRELEQRRQGAYDSLNTQIRDLKETHRQLHESTTNLRAALKSPTARGRWGEVQLRRVVELAGMERHVDFDEQSTEGGDGRPDLVARLPGGGILPIDAKVPLSAYLSAMETEDDDARRRHLAAHAQALRFAHRALLIRAPAGARPTRSRSSRISSIPRLEAASISITSSALPATMRRQASQSPHGAAVGPWSQLRAMARTSAVLVFPVPRGPQNR